MMVMMRSMSRATNDKSAMRIIMRKLVALAEKKNYICLEKITMSNKNMAQKKL